jgi:hypothetical protein
MLFWPVIQRVPTQVFRVGTVGMTPCHGDEQGGDVAAAGGEHIGEFVGRGAW